MLVDDCAGATARQLGDALTDIEVNGHFFGSASLTVVLQSNIASVAKRKQPTLSIASPR